MEFDLFETFAPLTVASYALAAAALLFGCYVNYVYRKWERDFSCHSRVKRTDDRSPSNKQRPDITKFDEAKVRIIKSSEKKEGFSKWDSIAAVKEKRKSWKENSLLREKARAIPFEGALETSERAKELDMDHVHIRFLDFLWGYCFIGPMSYLLWKKGTFVLLVRQYLAKKGIIKAAAAPDIEAVIGTLCLEQSQVIHYFAKTKKGSELGNVAGFFFPSFPYIDNDCNYCVADLLAVDIDLGTKRFVQAKMDGIDLTASETIILLWFNAVVTMHAKLHATANWGINDDASLDETNPFLRRNSVVTALYNFFGHTMFATFLKTWEKQGLLSGDWSEKDSVVRCLDHGVREGVGHHGHVTELMQHSRFVNFTVKVRAIFLNEFAKHKHLFPGVDGEALFVGTVLHSLDHTFMERNLPDPLWLDVASEKFGKTAELGRIIRVGFVEDVPFLYFRKRFNAGWWSSSNHPFYERVYEKAAKIDKELADSMDTCIVK